MNYVITAVVMVVGLVLAVTVAILFVYVFVQVEEKIAHTGFYRVVSMAGRVLSYVLFAALAFSMLLMIYADFYKFIWKKPLF